MANFVFQNDVQNIHGTQGMGCANLAQLGLHGRRGIKPACLKRARHQRHTGQHIALGFAQHVPQTGVRRKIAIVPAHGLQLGAQQAEMPRFLGRHTGPVPVVSRRHSAKAPDGVKRQIDRIELDMGHRMEQCGQAFKREG